MSPPRRSVTTATRRILLFPARQISATLEISWGGTLSTQ